MSDNKSQSGYKYLLSYQYSLVIYDFTQEFCIRYLPGRGLLRQRDQMTQAARSGKQNIAEGYEFQSLESYIKLLGVAKGSIKELLEDYEDHIRQNNLKLWPKDNAKMRELREIRVLRDPFPHIPQYPHLPHEIELVCNLMVMLCQRATYLLDRQIISLREKFVQEGGFREKLFRERLKAKSKNI